ncbi:MAG: cation-transporting P-type ATPase [Nitrospiraceae bacterium]
MKHISLDSLKHLHLRDGGLTDTDVSSQRARYGRNEIVEATGHSWIAIVLDTIKDPMIWFLLGIGLAFLLMGNSDDATILFLAMIPLMGMDTFLHWRTQASTEGLKDRLTSTVTAIRNDTDASVDSRELVPGDLIRAAPGLFLPADGLFQTATDIQVDESVLTGEALPISKRASPLHPFQAADTGETTIAPNTFGYAGTAVLTGHGTLRVVATGASTAYGEIVRSVSDIPHERTPLQHSIAVLVKWLIVAAVLLCLFLAAVRVTQGHGWLDAFVSAATLAIAAIPEEFPVVLTFFLGVGVYRLAQRHALVRRAVSVEHIGRITRICTDKTGTITIGRLQLTHLDPPDGLTDADLLLAAAAASNPDGLDPVDLAIRKTSDERTLVPPDRLRTFPFTEDRKRETAFVREHTGGVFASMKGAPETVLAASQLSDAARRQWKERTARWAGDGHKVLACARKRLTEDDIRHDEEPMSGFEFCGLLAFEDPPRPEVPDAIAYCRRNGIGVIMITGDHVATALAIAKDIGLGDGAPVGVSAEDDPERFESGWLAHHPEFLRELHVVARCTPIQKLEIVRALKAAGELVAVTGDGVNDVPALKAADIGIAMGERGVRSAKEVASIVLTDDNFRTIVGAIKEGRQLFTTLRLSFAYLLLLHLPFVLTAAFIPLLDYPLLYLPIHIVWLELILHPSALFAFQQEATAEETQRASHRVLFPHAEIVLILVVGLAVTIGVGLDFIAGLNESADIGHARARALTMLTLWSAGLVAYYSRLATWSATLIVAGTVLSSIGVVQMAPLAAMLRLTPLHIADWLLSVGSVCGFLLLLHVGEYIRARDSQHSPLNTQH